MKLERKYELLKKRFDEIQTELENEKKNHNIDSNKHLVLTNKLEIIFNDMKELINDFYKINTEYKNNLNDLRIYKTVMYNGKLPLNIRLRNKIQKLKILILSGK